MPTGSPVACAACGSSEARPLYEVRGFAIVQCRCGLARTVLPVGFDPAAIYSEAYFQGGHEDGYADYAASADALRAEFRGVVAQLAARTGGGALLELGSAYGFFLDVAQERFAPVVGVEISAAARAAAAGRGHVVEASLAEAMRRGPATFAAAVMLDVIEHLADPGDVIAQIAAVLRPGAPLVITTGDFGSAVARVMGKRWRLMTPPQHLWFFSPSTLTALLVRHGFAVESVVHPWKRVPLALMTYQLVRYVGGQGLLKRLAIPGALPVNLFDAMRVTAVRT